ncbi:MAG: nitroreductase family protein [Clostridia bacterium]|nr:nitroreductase family protein [Clostridia bacterium]
MNEVLRTIKKRRSIRSFKEEQIKQEELELILEAGMYAPSGHNEQPWHFTVIQNKELIQYMADKAKEIMVSADIEWMRRMALNPRTNITYKAPTLIVVSARKTAISWMADCSAAIQNMLLAAESLNIGSVWIGLLRFFYTQQDEVKKLNIPEGYEPVYSVALGYKALEKEPVAPKRVVDVVNYIK